jgi:hypothetical protein
MTSAWVVLIASVVGQYPVYAPGGYYPSAGYGYGYGYYGRTPLPAFDPMRYSRFYSGEGYYNYAPPVIANPEVINFPRSATSTATATSPGMTTTTTTAATPSTAAGITGRVLAVNEPQKQITLQLPASTVIVPYGPATHFLATDGNFPVVKPGNLISVNQNTITILRRSVQ